MFVPFSLRVYVCLCVCICIRVLVFVAASHLAYSLGVCAAQVHSVVSRLHFRLSSLISSAALTFTSRLTPFALLDQVSCTGRQLRGSKRCRKRDIERVTMISRLMNCSNSARSQTSETAAKCVKKNSTLVGIRNLKSIQS